MHALSTSSTTCFGFIKFITDGGADRAEEIGDALEQAGEFNKSAGKAGRAAQLLSSIWKRIPSLCTDAPDATSEPDFQRETALEAMSALDAGGISDAAEKYLTYKDYFDKIRNSAYQVRQAINKLPEAARNITGAASNNNEVLEKISFTTQINSSVTATSVPAAPAKIYIGGALSCLRGSNSIPNFIEFTNNCTTPVKTSWCFSNGSYCQLSSLQIIDINQKYTVSFPLESKKISYAACQASYQGRDVILKDELNSNTYTCSYWSR